MPYPFWSNRSPQAIGVVATETPALPIGQSLTAITALELPGRTTEWFGNEDNQRLRVAIVSPEVSAGAGVPHYWLALAKALSRTHEVHVFAAKTDSAELDGVRFHKIPSLPLGWFLGHMSFYLGARGRFLLGRLTFQKPFEVVLGVGALTPFADVTTVHFVQAREIELQREGLIPRPRPLVGLAGIDYALYSRTMAWLGGRFYRGSNASIVAISQSVKQDLALFEGANPAAISVVPNGVDVVRFCPANRERYRATTRESLGLTAANTAVLFVGNSWGRKGLATAIEAIDGPDQSDVRLIVVGDGEPSSFVETLPAELAHASSSSDRRVPTWSATTRLRTSSCSRRSTSPSVWSFWKRWRAVCRQSSVPALGHRNGWRTVSMRCSCGIPQTARRPERPCEPHFEPGVRRATCRRMAALQPRDCSGAASADSSSDAAAARKRVLAARA